MQVMLDSKTANPRTTFGFEREELAKPRFDNNLVEAILDVRLCHEDLPRLNRFKEFENSKTSPDRASGGAENAGSHVYSQELTAGALPSLLQRTR